MTNRPETEPNRCQGTTASGQPCGSPMVGPTGYCFAHDPEVSDEERTEVRQKGGRNSSAIARLSSHLPTELAEVVETLGDTIQGVRLGNIAPAVGNSIASLSRAIVAAHSAANDAERIAAFEEALAKLETVVGQARQGLKVV